jgi:hypothetical protein
MYDSSNRDNAGGLFMYGGASDLQLAGDVNPTARCKSLHYHEVKELKEEIGTIATKYVDEKIHKDLAASTNKAANAAALIESKLLKFTEDTEMFIPLQIVLLLTKRIFAVVETTSGNTKYLTHQKVDSLSVDWLVQNAPHLIPMITELAEQDTSEDENENSSQEVVKKPVRKNMKELTILFESLAVGVNLITPVTLWDTLVGNAGLDGDDLLERFDISTVYAIFFSGLTVGTFEERERESETFREGLVDAMDDKNLYFASNEKEASEEKEDQPGKKDDEMRSLTDFFTFVSGLYEAMEEVEKKNQD